MVWSSRSYRSRSGIISITLALMLFITACGGGDSGTDSQDATPTVTETVAETVPSPEPSATPEPTPTATVFTPAPTVAAPLYNPPQAQNPMPDPVDTRDEPASTATPESTTPDPTPNGGGGVDGQIYFSDLTDCIPSETENVHTFGAEDGCHIAIEVTEAGTEYDFSDTYRISDAHISIDVQMLAGGENSVACVLFRSEADIGTGRYSFCLTGDGKTAAEYVASVNGENQFEILFPYEQRPGAQPATEWNRLEIIGQGQNLGFYNNDHLIGTIAHAGRLEGGFGYLAHNFDSTYTEWLFTNLDVWELAAGTVEEPADMPEEPADVPEDPVDVAGELGEEVIWDDLTTCPTAEFDIGSTFASNAGCHIVNNNPDGYDIFHDWGEAGLIITDAIASVDVLMVEHNPHSFACLTFRTGPLGWDDRYMLCVDGSGGVAAYHQVNPEDGQSSFDTLLEFGYHVEAVTPEEWTRLTIVAKGENFLFYVNDQVAGSATHPGPPDGSFGFMLYNFADYPAEWVFTNLDVWTLE